MVKFRLKIAFYLLRLTVFVIDKTSVEGLSLVIVINNWLNYLEEIQKEAKE